MARRPRQVVFELSDADGVERKVPFPQKGLDIVKGPLTYKSDGLATTHADDFRYDERFKQSYRIGAETTQPKIKIFWRMHTIFWAGSHALHLPGDFVECGVSRGMYSAALAHYLAFQERTDRRFYLFDTYEGIPVETLTEEEIASGVAGHNKSYSDCYDDVCGTFAAYPNVEVVKGIVPGSLERVRIDRVAYLSIDMNSVVAEMGAAAFFWPRLVPGAVVVLDDYGFPRHRAQKQAWDAFALRHGFAIMTSPTGQGIWIKPG